MRSLLNQQSKKSLSPNFWEEKILQSILSSETLNNYNKKRRERSSEGKYTTLTFKARKTRYIALKNDTKKQDHFDLAFFFSCFKSNEITNIRLIAIFFCFFNHFSSSWLSIIRNLHFIANDLATILSHVQKDINSQFLLQFFCTYF